MKKCFFTECQKEVNARGKFCEEHDKKERESHAEILAMFAEARTRANENINLELKE